MLPSFLDVLCAQTSVVKLLDVLPSYLNVLCANASVTKLVDALLFCLDVLCAHISVTKLVVDALLFYLDVLCAYTDVIDLFYHPSVIKQKLNLFDKVTSYLNVLYAHFTCAKQSRLI